ncbi:MAG TPA: protein-disulfide reductase DsbD domain-containing protein [Phycisphaerae bacterium]|nr:protein-disulfide reductase DsbD domain-containing protein [Phycisphaerae bacterium]
MRSARLRCIVGAIAILLAKQAFAASPSVDVKAVANTAAIAPGRPFQVAVTVTPEPGWHIYWKNPGDTGLPTKVKWNLPDGFVAGELQFPIPHQFTMPGDITAYGYEGPTTFLVTITPPKVLKAGETITLKATASWLCCKEECVPGRETFEVSLPVVEQPVPANQPLFQDAQAQMPLDHPPTALGTIRVEISKTAVGQAFTLKTSAPGLKLEMFPENVPGLSVSDIRSPTDSEIQFNARVMEGQTLPVQELPVLIVYRNAAENHAAGTNSADSRSGFYTKISLSGLSASDTH